MPKARPTRTPKPLKPLKPATSTAPAAPPPLTPCHYEIYCSTTALTPTAPKIARDYVTAVLKSRHMTLLVDDAAVCTSELMTNACLHARNSVGAVLRMVVDVAGPVALRVTVHDGDPGNQPRLLEGYDPESGRGLRLVDMLTEGHWGTVPGAPLPGGGKGVWFELGHR
ncbi:hypothetical protein GCM10018793_21610 [Streptomyces sulfonofaciens]|uniref:Histidine kinase/HSP90-like ATPase domain-containing protein n=1 Tax=Streptomyces sulfonofaciens TaxID=68272 RepID=A0A919G174_9ACTN|nr:ATP-binding protein [Streptomyces sulfonofaciens]GHH76292.1 hypothetical protein GCM10018793_21610 [Streptomyces sulfonofaciens]